MHYTGTIWRPPFEANSALLQVTAGCTHNKCKFCSLYDGVKFCLSPIDEIVEDLAELSRCYPQARRVFLTGANPFALSFDKLQDLAINIKQYLPNVTSIGGFSRITDITPKTAEQLNKLHELGYDAISIGTETGDDITLGYMNKGYASADIVEQLKRFDEAGISYNITYLNGLAGSGNSERNALETAMIFNQTNPSSVNIVALTVFPEAELYQAVQSGEYVEAGELEKLYEQKILIENLTIQTTIFANTISNAAPMVGTLPKDKSKMVNQLQYAIDTIDETELKRYRASIHHL